MGVNTQWKMTDFPWGIAATMNSLHELSGKRPIDNRALLQGFLDRLQPRYEALLSGRFDNGGWSSAQRTTGRTVVVDAGDNSVTGKGVGVDPESGALLVQPDFGSVVAVDSGEVIRCRVI